MRFGPIPVAEAEGAVLAHGLRLEGIAFKKGRVLSAEDVAALQRAGQTSIVAARLDPGDVPEDVAAAQIAAAVAGDNLSRSAAFTGRCNLFASARGLAVIDTARVDRLNLVDEAVTIATLPSFVAVEARQMAATIKIIPFASPRPALDAALAIAAEGGPPVRVAPFLPSRVGLIQTRIEGMKESILDRTVAMTRQRVEAAASALVAPDLRCQHRIAPHFGQHLDPVHNRHVQITDNHIRTSLPCSRQPFPAVRRLLRRPAFDPENHGDGATHHLFVIYDKNPRHICLCGLFEQTRPRPLS